MRMGFFCLKKKMGVSGWPGRDFEGGHWESTKWPRWGYLKRRQWKSESLKKGRAKTLLKKKLVEGRTGGAVSPIFFDLQFHIPLSPSPLHVQPACAHDPLGWNTGSFEESTGEPTRTNEAWKDATISVKTISKMPLSFYIILIEWN